METVSVLLLLLMCIYPLTLRPHQFTHSTPSFSTPAFSTPSFSAPLLRGGIVDESRGLRTEQLKYLHLSGEVFVIFDTERTG